jgi:hypothetical protein
MGADAPHSAPRRAWTSRVIAAICLAIATLAPASAGAQPPGPPPASPPTAQGDAPAATRPPPPPPALEITTSSLLQHRLGEWSTLDIRATNPTSEPKEAIVSILFEGGQRQYARRLWVPANGDRTTWLPIKVPAEAKSEGGLEYTSLILEAGSERELLNRREGEGLTSSAVLRISADPVRSALIVPRPMLNPTLAWENLRKEWPQVLAAARTSRSLNPTSPLIVPDFLPPWPMTSRGLDVLLLATDRLENDTAGMAMLRGWVRDGGRLWIALDAVSPETVEAILGHDAGIEVVDRVEIDRFTVETRDRENGMERTDEIDLEVPVDLVRVVTSHADVPARVGGWPAAIWVPCGQGDILITTIGPRALVQPDGVTATGATATLATRLLAGRPDRLDVARLQGGLEKQIGYATPSRWVAATILGLFCAGLCFVGWRWGARHNLDRLAWFVPATSVAAAAVLGLIGAASSRSVEPTIAEGTLLRLSPSTDEALLDGAAAVFDRESRATAWTGRERTWVFPDASQGTNGERVTWLDDDQEATQNTTTHAGSVDKLALRGALGRVDGGRVRARFGPEGLEGRIDRGTLGPLRDPVIVGMPGPAQSVTLRDDGSFVAAVDGVLAPGQYNPASILEGDARWRQEAARRLLQTPEEYLIETGRPKAQAPNGIAGALALRRRPWMLFWCEPEAGPTWEPPAGFVERRATIGLSPVDIEQTPSGSPFRIPPPFLPARPGVTDQGKSNAFDSRRGEWVKGLTTATDTLLRFQLPDAVLPCTLDRGRLTIRVNAPSRDVTVGAFRDGQPIVLERFTEPNGVFEIDLGPEHLAVDGGTVPISIAISRTVAERAEDARGAAPTLDKKQYEQQIDTSVSSTWDIDYVRLSVDGRTN